MARILEVEFRNGLTKQFGVPAGWQVPTIPPPSGWLVIPTPEGQSTSIALATLADVLVLRVFNERAAGKESDGLADR